MTVLVDMIARDTILDLLSKARTVADVAEATVGLRDQERLCGRACSYLDAATTLLHAHANMHNELIEHPQFMSMRRWAREHRV